MLVRKGTAQEGQEARSRGLVARPHWWAVLAVSLALMALVASLSTPTRGTPTGAGPNRSRGRQNPTGRRVLDGHGRQSSITGARSDAGARVAGGPADRAGAGDAPGTASGAGAGTPGQGTAASPTTVPTTAVVALPAATLVAPAASAAGSSPTTTSTAPPPTTVTTAAPAATRSEAEVGNLTYPDNVSATYTVPGGGPVQATATWSGSPDLTLTVSCPDRSAHRTGGSGLTVAVPAPSADDPGTCTVTVAEPTGVEATVSYTLDVDTAGGPS